MKRPTSGICRLARVVIVFCLWMAAWCIGGASEPARGFSVAIRPYGKIPESDLDAAKAGIEKLYLARVTVLPPRELPAEAYYHPRKRYIADRLLNDLADSTPDGFDKVVGLTEKDISTAKNGVANWGIMGLGDIDGRPCVISTFRLNLHQDASPALVMARLVNVVNHELGNTLGLEHCPNAGCLMEDANGTIKTVDNEAGVFCPNCLEELKDMVSK